MAEKPARRLPVKELFILSICRFAEPIALTSVNPYLPEMIQSFGVPELDIARWAGLTSSIFSACQCLTGVPWGYASDRFGRKTIILVGLTNTMVMMLIWGFSTSLPMAMTARAIQGLGNGNVGILRTTVAELCPWKELQPRAFSIMPLVYNIGAILGPTLGGALSNPLGVDPTKPRGDKFLERYPYILPNIVAAAFFTFGITTGFLYLNETLETKKNERDYGIILGKKINAIARNVRTTIFGKSSTRDGGEREPLLASQQPLPRKSIDDEESSPISPKNKQEEESAKISHIITKQVVLNLIVYTLLALYSTAYDQLLPVFMHHKVQDLDSPGVTLPFKFASGFGFKNNQIGLLFTILGGCCMFFQLVIFPPMANRFGILPCLRMAFIIYPIVYFLTPFTALLPTPLSRQLAMLALMIVRGFAGTFAFPCSTILITNNASSLRTLGTLNGIATSVSAIGRAAGPAIGGGVFTMGVKRGYIIAPFWTLGAISILAFIPTLYLVEGKGFGDEEDTDSDSILSATAASPTFDGQEDGVKPVATENDDDALASEDEFGEPTRLLSHTDTMSSHAIDSDDEFAEEDVRPAPPLRRATTSSMGGQQRRMIRRKSSVPIGMGMGFRRLSSNLGSTGLPDGSWGG